MKTGSLFACAAELRGAVISGAPDEVVRRLQSYGAKIGTAYQIYDDCLDIAGTEIETGKTLGTDLRKGKLTLPVLTLLESASAFDRERCCVLVLEGKLEEVTALLQNSPTNGALNASIETAAELIRDAQGARLTDQQSLRRFALRPGRSAARVARTTAQLSLVCHPEQSEGSLTIFRPNQARKWSEMFRSAQHDRIRR